MKSVTSFVVVVLVLCFVQSSQAVTLGGSINGSGWLPGGGRPAFSFTKEEHKQAQQEAILNASELLDLHVAAQLWAYPKQVYAYHLILDDYMTYYPNSPAHYTYSIMSYVIVFESGEFVVVDL
jgi:hypothetical protein